MRHQTSLPKQQSNLDRCGPSKTGLDTQPGYPGLLQAQGNLEVISHLGYPISRTATAAADSVVRRIPHSSVQVFYRKIFSDKVLLYTISEDKRGRWVYKRGDFFRWLKKIHKCLLVISWLQALYITTPVIMSRVRPVTIVTVPTDRHGVTNRHALGKGYKFVVHPSPSWFHSFRFLPIHSPLVPSLQTSQARHNYSYGPYDGYIACLRHVARE